MGPRAATATPSPPSRGVTLTTSELAGLSHEALKAAIIDLASSNDVDPSLIGVASLKEVEWASGALGCPEPGVAYTQAIVPGFQVLLVVGNVEHYYHTGHGAMLLCPEERRDDPYREHPVEGVWSILMAAPTARREIAAAELDGKIYVLGGFGRGATANEEYDTGTDTWRVRAPIPQGVDHAAAVSYDRIVYLIGGFSGNFRPVSTVWAYDPSKDTWTRKADLAAPRGALGAALVDGRIYAIGGVGLEGDVGTTEVYDPSADIWSAHSPMPTRRDHLAIATVQGRIYVTGGRLGSFARNLSANEVYHPTGDTWSGAAHLPTARSGIAAAEVDGRFYVFGGESPEGAFEENERYDPDVDDWMSAPPLPTARHGLAAVALRNRVYVLAGGPTPEGSQSGANEVFIVLVGR